MTGQTILFIFLMIIIFLLSNYIALIYGIRLGKAMQDDIPPVPIEPATNAAKKVCKLIRDWPKKTYLQKKARKEEDNFYDY